jgi:sugar/nucleoside kinase (ribokinase family)
MDVICLGILVADIFSSPLDSLPPAGQLAMTERFFLGAGGCATNTAACLSRLGRKVRVLGKVGGDLFGNFVLEDLRRLGVDASSVSRSQTHPTSGTVIINVKGEDRRYIHSIGANADFSFADVDCSLLDGAKALYVGGYMAMPRFGAEDLTRLFREAKRRSLVTILDVVAPPGLSLSKSQLRDMLAFTDVFLPNDDEAFAMTGQRDPEAQTVFLTLLNPNCTVVVTQGPRGALARGREVTIRVGTYSVNSIDGSGAGDAFAAGFITGLLEGWTLESTLRFASAVGASCTRALGCINGVFQFDEAQEFISKNPLKLERLQP